MIHLKDNNQTHYERVQEYAVYKMKVEKLLGCPKNVSWVKCIKDPETDEILVTDINIQRSDVHAVRWGNNLINLYTLEIPSFVEGFKDTEILRDTLNMYPYIKLIYRGDSIESLEGLFQTTQYVEYVDLSEFSLRGVKSLRGMFAFSNIQEVVFKPETLDKLQVADRVFESCKDLIKVNLKDLKMTNVRQAGRMFTWCERLEDIDTSFLKHMRNLCDASQMFAATGIEEVNLQGLNFKYPIKLDSCFEACKNLKRFKASQSVNGNIKVSSMDKMFQNCFSLDDIDISGLDLQLVSKLDSVFDSCQQLKSFSLYMKRLNNLRQATEVFAGCRSLREVKIVQCHVPMLKSLVQNFTGCVNLDCIDITHTDLSAFEKEDRVHLNTLALDDPTLQTQDIKIKSGKKKFRIRHHVSITELGKIQRGKRQVIVEVYKEYIK